MKTNALFDDCLKGVDPATREEVRRNMDIRDQKDFLCRNQECSWNELYFLIGKENMMHDYPYYFDENGNDIYPSIRK